MEKHICLLNEARINYDGKAPFPITEQVHSYRHSSSEDIIERSKGMHILISKELKMDQRVIEGLDASVELICEAGTGYNNIDLAACKKRGIAVCNTPAYSSQRVAQTAIMLMLNLFSSMQVQLRMLERGDHRNFTEHLLVDHLEVNGKVLGVVGEGSIGKEVIRIARAMDMEILIYTRTPKKNREHVRYVSLHELLQESDVVSLHCPLHEATFHLLGEKEFQRMKPTAFLINTSRGALIDEAALLRALRQKQLAGAGLDVQEEEPPRPDHPFYTMEQVIITPHMGWRGLETRRRLQTLTAENVQAWLRGTPQNQIC